MIDIPNNFDAFFISPDENSKSPYERCSLSSRAKSVKDKIDVRRAETRVITLLFLEWEGYECTKEIEKATQKLREFYRLITTGREAINGAVDEFAGRANQEVGKFLNKKKEPPHETMDRAFEECEQILINRSNNKGIKLPSSLTPAMKHSFALFYLKHHGYTCDAAFEKANDYLEQNLIDAKFVLPGPSAGLYVATLIQELGMRLGMRESPDNGRNN